MDPTIVGALIATGGVLLTAGGGTVGAYLVYRGKRRELDAATVARREEADVQAFERAERIYSNSIKRLSEDVADLIRSREADQAERGSLRARIRGLEAAQDRDQRRIDLLTDYVRALQRMLRANEIPFPSPPDELDLLGTDPGLPAVT